MEQFYTAEKNTLITLSILKANKISKVIASPGTTNMALIGSMQNDSFFEIYSAPDERSAAYMACGLSLESGEPVVLSCTGATASRNYMPGLTEAFYRKLPIIAITSATSYTRCGNLYPQFVDRIQQPKDLVKLSVQIPAIRNSEDEHDCILKVNQAVLESRRRGGGPVHINLVTEGEYADFSVKELPSITKMTRYTAADVLPPIPKGKIAIFIGSHKDFTNEETKNIELFCEKYDSVVFCDHTSGYYGRFRVQYAIGAVQNVADDNLIPDLLIHLGEVSGDYFVAPKLRQTHNVWRVSEDGELRDYFMKLSCVFEMKESLFFNNYISKESNEKKHGYYDGCKERLNSLYSKIPDLPFSNVWVAYQLHDKIPHNSTIHFGILNSLRSWNYFELDNSIRRSCNVGGFGIDGNLSTVMGASLANPNKLFFDVVGDLAFFYDMNSLANRHVGKNLRIILVNNGKGTEFRNYSHPASKLGERADMYIAAGGHYGNLSDKLVKHYIEDLGFDYYKASNKEEFESVYKKLLQPVTYGKSILLELFTNSEDESDALKAINEIQTETNYRIKRIIKKGIKAIIS